MEATTVANLLKDKIDEFVEVERQGMTIGGRLISVDETGVLIAYRELGFALIHGKYSDCVMEKHYFIPHDLIMTVAWTK